MCAKVVKKTLCNKKNKKSFKNFVFQKNMITFAPPNKKYRGVEQW